MSDIYDLEPLRWQQRSGGVVSDISLRAFSNFEAGARTQADAVIFMGYGEHALTARRVLSHLLKDQVAAIAVTSNSKQVPCDQLQYATLVQETGNNTIAQLQERGVLAQPKIPALGNSLGSMILASADPSMVGNSVLMSPVGIDYEQRSRMYPPDEARAARLRKDFYKVLVHPLPWLSSPVGSFISNIEVGSQVLSDFSPFGHNSPKGFRGRFKTIFNTASNMNTYAHVQNHLQAGNDVLVMVREQDPLITEVPPEIQHLTYPGGHANFAWNSTLSMARVGIKWLGLGHVQTQG